MKPEIPKRVFFVGAGVSTNPPSKIPVATSITSHIIDAVAPTRKLHTRFLELMRSQHVETQNPGDYIRFEMLMEVIQEFIDPNLSVLHFLDQYRTPNSLHLILAERAAMGESVITTNFDSLIEDACLQLSQQPQTLCSLSEFAAWPGVVASGMVPIFKIHGSIQRVVGRSRREPALGTVDATLKSITQGATELILPTAKRRFLNMVTRDSEVIVAGYSGSDDFDILPSLFTIVPKRILWIDHDIVKTKAVDVTTTVCTAILALSPEKRSARDRLFLYYFLTRPGVLKIISASTQTYLLHRFGKQATTVQASEKNPPNLKLFFSTWKKDHLSTNSDRYAICGEVFFRLGRYREAKDCFINAISLLEPQHTPIKAAHYMLAAARNSTELAEYKIAQRWLNKLSRSELRVLPKYLMARFLHHKGLVAMNLGDVENALKLLNKAEQFASTNGVTFIEATAIHDQGIIHQDRGEYVKALKCYRTSIKLSRKIGDIRHVSWSIFQIGIIMCLQGHFACAERLILKSQRIAELNGDLSHSSNCLHELALFAFLKGQLTKAINNSHRCIKIAPISSQDKWLGVDWQHIGVCLLDAGHLNWSEAMFDKADLCYIKVEEKGARSELFSYYAALALKRNDLAKARKRAAFAVRLAKQSRMPEYLSRAIFMLGLTHFRQGRKAMGMRLVSLGFEQATQIKEVLLDLAFYAACYPEVLRKKQEYWSVLYWAKHVYKKLGNQNRYELIQEALRNLKMGHQ